MKRKDLIWGLFRSFVHEFGHKPNTVLMHPQFFEDLITHEDENHLLRSQLNSQNKYIFDLKIIRTFDVEKTEILISLSK